MMFPADYRPRRNWSITKTTGLARTRGLIMIGVMHLARVIVAAVSGFNLCFTAGAAPLPALADHAKHLVIASASVESPRNDCGTFAPLTDGALFLVWHKYRPSGEQGSDFGPADITCRISRDHGQTWGEERRIIPLNSGDLNIQAPAIVRLPNGELLIAALRVHGKGSSSMCLFRSGDDGVTWKEAGTIWARSKGQWLQGGTPAIVPLATGRLLLPFHGGTGEQGNQHNTAGCFVSDDLGFTWRKTKAVIDLPMRGAMEASVAAMGDGRLVMSLRSQLGTVFLCESRDGGESWSLPWSSGLTAPESATCIRRIPGSEALVLVWDGCEFYEPRHHHFGQRNPLSLAYSTDYGRTWRRLGDLQNDPACEFANVNLTFTAWGDAIVTYWVVSPPFYRKFAPRRSDLGASLIRKAYWRALLDL